MFEGFTFGQYFPGASPLHRLDPRTKITLTLIFSVAAFLPRWGPSLVVLASYTLLAILLSRVPAGVLLRGLRPLWFLLAFTTLLNLFWLPGEPLWQWGFLTITRQGALQALFIGLRLLLLVLTVQLLTLTTAPLDLTEGLEQMLRPFRRFGVPAHELALMMTIALRFIPTLVEEATRIMRAQESRGADLQSGGLVKRAKAFLPILIPLFVAAFRRADELAVAMEARGYRGGAGRTRLKQLRFGAADGVAALATALWLLTLIFVWSRWG